jgi:hypothetical protein
MIATHDIHFKQTSPIQYCIARARSLSLRREPLFFLYLKQYSEFR